MSFSYSGDPSTSDRDELRFTLQDTDAGFQLLTDEELDFLLVKWLEKFPSVTFVASIAAATISRKFTGIVAISSDGVSVSTGDLAQRYRDLAANLRDEYKADQVGAEVDITNLLIGYSLDPSIKPLRFGIGLHDNLEAGQQDYGGWTYSPYELDRITW